jgi:large subunit ribosomal protein L2
MALKQFNPTSPGRRGLVLIDRSELHKGRPEKSLVEGLTKSGGRGGGGRIAVRFRGGGAKRLYRSSTSSAASSTCRHGRASRIRSEPHRLHRADQV